MENTPKKKKMPTWLIIVLVIVALGVIKAATGGDDSGSATAAEAEAPSVSIAAPDLKKQYDENEVRADQQFKSKTVAVTGVISRIGNDIIDHPYVVLTGGGQYEMFGVQCTMKDKNAVAALNKGQTVTIVGKCKGKLGNVLMSDCSLQ